VVDGQTSTGVAGDRSGGTQRRKFSAPGGKTEEEKVALRGVRAEK